KRNGVLSQPVRTLADVSNTVAVNKGQGQVQGREKVKEDTHAIPILRFRRLCDKLITLNCNFPPTTHREDLS
ncbi:MAG: hypothetical protein RSD32_08795, partial [Oscillospiraceae bacterium]